MINHVYIEFKDIKRENLYKILNYLDKYYVILINLK